MFSSRLVFALALIASASIAAGPADERGTTPGNDAERVQPATPDDHLRTQLDWRSYYLVRPQTRRDLAGPTVEPEPHAWLAY